VGYGDLVVISWDLMGSKPHPSPFSGEIAETSGGAPFLERPSGVTTTWRYPKMDGVYWKNKQTNKHG